MGREIRRVPENWEHPKRKRFDFRTGQEVESYRPMHDQDYESALSEWLKEYKLWKAGQHPSQTKYPDFANQAYWEYAGGPSDPEYYRPAWSPKEMTHYQIYETVSEGTPVSPIFKDKADLVQWLIDQGYSEQAASGFAEHEWCFSGALCNGEFKQNYEIYDCEK